MIETQMRFATAWLDMASQGFRAIADAQAQAMQQSARLMEEATRAFRPPQPAFPFMPTMPSVFTAFPSIPGFPASPAPTAWPFLPMPSTSAWTPWTAFQPAMNPFANNSNPWLQAMSPATWMTPATWFNPMGFNSNPASQLLENAAAAYRTAGGHATAVVLTSLSTPKAPQPFFWAWPVPRVLHAPTF